MQVMELKTYCAFIEVVPLTGCSLSPSEVAGAVVRCYVRAQNAQHAESRCRADLEAERFSVVAVEWCVAIDETEWENPDDEDHVQYVRVASETDGAVFGEFHSWGIDTPAS